MSRYLHLPVAALLLLVATPVAAQERTRVATADDLPPRTYSVPGSATRLLEDDVSFATFTSQLASDLREDLERFEIADPATVKRFYQTLGYIALLEERYDVAVAYADSVRLIEDKPALRALAGTLERAFAAAAAADPAGRQDRFHAAYREEIAALPFDLVQSELKSLKANMEFYSPGLITGVIESMVEPAARSGDISGELASTVVYSRFYLRALQPVQAAVAAVLGDVIARHAVDKPDIWAARDVALDDHPSLTPVLVGIWDTGVDASVFEGRMFVNPGEIPGNGIDDDGNGFVDDVHGIAFDIQARRTPELLYPLSATTDEPLYRGYMKGLADLMAGIDSEVAAALRKLTAAMRPDEVGTFIEGISEYGNYAHGTHVAGITLAGNPAARLLGARVTFDHRRVPRLPTLDWIERWAASGRDIVDYFRSAGVRVVNMSWGLAPEVFERGLELNNAGGNPEERRAEARRLHDVLASALQQAIADASDILFIAAAGNADSDVQFGGWIPASFELPNVLTIAAVDRAGDEAAFTSYGKVELYANGYEVDSYMPGGTRMSLSGTSMAAPQVANLAAKLLAVYPHLTIAQLRHAILDGAEEKSVREGKRIRILHPARSFEIAERLAGSGQP